MVTARNASAEENVTWLPGSRRERRTFQCRCQPTPTLEGGRRDWKLIYPFGVWIRSEEGNWFGCTVANVYAHTRTHTRKGDRVRLHVLQYLANKKNYDGTVTLKRRLMDNSTCVANRFTLPFISSFLQNILKKWVILMRMRKRMRMKTRKGNVDWLSDVIYLHVHWLIDLLIHSLIHLLIYSLIHSLIHWWIDYRALADPPRYPAVVTWWSYSRLQARWKHSPKTSEGDGKIKQSRLRKHEWISFIASPRLDNMGPNGVGE